MVFTRSSPTAWGQTGSKLIAIDTLGTAQQGSSVTISSNGSIFGVGGPLDNSGLGANWIYNLSGSTYIQSGYKRVATGYNTITKQGSSVSISEDGKLLISGAPQIGVTYVFMP